MSFSGIKLKFTGIKTEFSGIRPNVQVLKNLLQALVTSKNVQLLNFANLMKSHAQCLVAEGQKVAKISVEMESSEIWAVILPIKFPRAPVKNKIVVS